MMLTMLCAKVQPATSTLTRTVCGGPGESRTLESHKSVGYAELLRANRAFRFLWLGQVVSQMGDWFDTIAVIHHRAQTHGFKPFGGFDYGRAFSAERDHGTVCPA